MKKVIYFSINGILTIPGKCNGWTDNSTTWINVNTPFKAEKLEYWSGVLTRRFFWAQEKRAKKFAKRISFYKGWEINIIAHSNGADVVKRMLKYLEGININKLHLVSPACTKDIYKYKKEGKIKQIKVYVGGKDKAMKLAKLSRLFNFIKLSYGNLGGEDLSVLKRLLGAKNVIYKANYGHSSWFEEENGNFEGFMNLIVS